MAGGHHVVCIMAATGEPWATGRISLNLSRLQLGIPVEEIQPAVVQMVRRELPPGIAQLVRRRAARRFAQVHPGPAQAFRSLFQVAGRTGRHHVFPAGDPTGGARHHVIEGQIALAAAILAAKFIP